MPEPRLPLFAPPLEIGDTLGLFSSSSPVIEDSLHDITTVERSFSMLTLPLGATLRIDFGKQQVSVISQYLAGAS